MRAAWYERRGPAREVLTIGEMPAPQPGAGQVRVRIHASGVNPTDVKARAGWGPNTTMPFPRVVPHHDGAGVIDSVGPGATAWHVGDRVWVYEAQWRRPFGTAAEFVVLPVRNVAPLPDHVDFAQGAALGIPAMTAHRCLFQDGPIHGQFILITGGAGAVGNAAVQLAKWRGATVLATISRPEQAEAARLAGADHVLNYKTDDVPARIRDILRAANVEGLDRIVEVSFAQNIVNDLALLRPGGVISTYAAGAYDIEARFPFYPAMFKGITMHFVLEYIMPEPAHVQAVQEVTAALRDRALRPQIARRFPLEQIADAHEAVEQGKLVGKAVVELA
jgi:NADPH2:quinone reductase